MSVAASIEAAAAGRLPDWARMGKSRRAHAGRVAALMAEWAERLALPPADRLRWAAAGWLHDSLRDAPGRVQRELAGPAAADLPRPVLHGHAAAARLRADGVDDEELLDAVAWHTFGHPGFGALGRALYIADYVEPGRRFDRAGRAALRDRMPADLDDVALRVAAARLRHQLDRERPLRQETVAFWNRLADGGADPAPAAPAASRADGAA